MRKILVTSALPYANGPIHLGHLVEYIQTDIWVRQMRQMGHQVTYVCADDAHGTAIMLKAEANGISPETQIANVQAEHERDFAGFGVAFDHYDSTHSEENKQRAQAIYRTLFAQQHIAMRPVTQLYDPQKGLFLADRFVKGECPKCGAADQYGDNCDVCGATYNATELKNPYSVFSGARPELKESEHYFFKLSNFTAFLTQWTQSGTLQSSIANKLKEWLDAGLSDWDISRDAPYFGFEIPDAPGKYFYVWLDAPIGYMSSFERLCKKQHASGVANPLVWEDYWLKNSSAEVYHFIGKDIVNFHGLFWPAMLEGAGYRTPTGVFAHGHLMVNGEKMSKSKGTFITADSYLQYLNPECLRYYFASKLSDTVDDIDLNLEDFRHKVNGDLVGKVVNIASRCAGFITKHFNGQLSATMAEPELLNKAIMAGESIAQAYEQREYARAVREIMAVADWANQYIDEQKPWVLAKQVDANGQVTPLVQDVCTVGLNLFRQLMVYLQPILPALAQRALQFLNVVDATWQSRHQLLLNHTIAPFTPLMQRVEPTQVADMLAHNQQQMGVAAQTSTQVIAQNKTKAAIATAEKPNAEKIEKIEKAATEEEAEAAYLDIKEFAKVDLRVGVIKSAAYVEGSDKLLQLMVDVGEENLRQIFSGIRPHYTPEQLVGVHTVVVANLAPRKMRFGVSEGMVLAAGNDQGVFILSPHTGAKAGDKVT